MEKVPESGHREAGRGNVQALESRLYSLDHSNWTGQKAGGGAGSAVDKGKPHETMVGMKTSLASKEVGRRL